MNVIHKLNDFVIRIVTALCLTLLSLLTIATMTGVIFRYVLKSPVVWLYETVVLIFAWTVFSGVVLAYSKQENIHLTFVMSALSEKGKKILATIIDIINLTFIFMVVFYGFQLVKSTSAQSYNTINVSLGWFYASFPVMGIPMIITILDRAIGRFETKSALEVVKNKEIA